MIRSSRIYSHGSCQKVACPPQAENYTASMDWFTNNSWWLTPLGTALATIISSGIFASIVSERHINRRTELEFKRKKLEELFSLVNQWCLSQTQYYQNEMPESENSVYESTNTEAPIPRRGDADLATIEMLVTLYFPDLEPLLNDLMTSSQYVANQHDNYIEAANDIEELQEVARKVAKELELFQITRRKFLEHIGREYAPKLKCIT